MGAHRLEDRRRALRPQVVFRLFCIFPLFLLLSLLLRPDRSYGGPDVVVVFSQRPVLGWVLPVFESGFMLSRFVSAAVVVRFPRFPATAHSFSLPRYVFQFRVFGGSGRQFSRLRSDRCSGRLISLLPALRSVVWHALCNSIVNCGSATAVRFLHLFKFGLVVLGGQPPEAAGNREIPCCFCLARSQACRTFFQQVAKTFIRDSFPALSGCNIRPTALRYLLRPPLPARKSKEKPRPTFVRRGLLCPGQDSNLHELNVHYPLKVACLPISPPGRHMTETCISGAQI